jgi:hypothetical protein
MRVILDIKDDKVAFFMEVLKGFSSFVKVKKETITPDQENTPGLADSEIESAKYLSPAIIAELDKRMEDYKKDPSSAMDMEQFIKELENEDE